MSKKPSFLDKTGVPVFTAADFFRKDENVYIHKSIDFPEYVGTVHQHEFIEIVFVLSGEAKHYTPQGTFNVSRGDLILIEKNIPHAFYEKKTGSEKFIAYDLCFTPDCIDTSLINLSSFKDLCSSYMFYSLYPAERKPEPTLKLSGNVHKYFGDIFDRIYEEYTKQPPGYLSLLQAYVTELIIKMLRKLNEPKQSVNSSKMRAVNEIIHYFNEHFSERIKLDDIARKTFFSKDYLSRFFKEATGSNPQTFLIELRLKNACSKLKSSNSSVYDIALSCGFEDLSYFYKLFKKHYGVTPNEYRING